MSDPLHDALRDATLAVLLGSTEVPYQSVGSDGTVAFQGTASIPSAFAGRIQSRAHQGEFDALISEAMTKVDADAVARAVEGLLAEQILKGMNATSHYGQPQPGWLQAQARSIAVEACTKALAADEALLDNLRARIGAEVDRNRVSISVQLADPE